MKKKYRKRLTEPQILKLLNFVKNNKIAIHCPTIEDYRKLNEILKNNNLCQVSSWFCFQSHTCYSEFFEDKNYFACIGYYKNNNFKILTVQELFDKFKIKKEEIKPIEDIEYDSRTGRIIRINNYESETKIYLTNVLFDNCFKIKNLSRDYADYIIYMGFGYYTMEARNKAEQEMIKKVEEENKKIGVK